MGNSNIPWIPSRFLKWIGIALMLYPYAVSDTLLLYAVGGVLCAGLYVFRK